jgi:hypothetical protein
MTYTLELIFGCEDGTTSSIYVKNAISTVTSATVTASGQAIASANTLANAKGSMFNQFKSANMIIEQPII